MRSLLSMGHVSKPPCRKSIEYETMCILGVCEVSEKLYKKFLPHRPPMPMPYISNGNIFCKEVK